MRRNDEVALVPIRVAVAGMDAHRRCAAGVGKKNAAPESEPSEAA